MPGLTEKHQTVADSPDIVGSPKRQSDNESHDSVHPRYREQIKIEQTQQEKSKNFSPTQQVKRPEDQIKPGKPDIFRLFVPKDVRNFYSHVKIILPRCGFDNKSKKKAVDDVLSDKLTAIIQKEHI